MSVKIYKITNNINGKIYIGQTKTSIERRFISHKSAARRGINYILYKAIRKYSQENFKIELIEEVENNLANEREIYWIAKYSSTNNNIGYNSSIGGNVVNKPVSISKEKVLELFNLGNSAVKISKMFHIDIHKITDILKSENIKYGQEKQMYSKDILESIINEYKNGLSIRAISKKLNLDRHCISKALKRSNILVKRNKLPREVHTLPDSSGGENVL